MEKQKQCCIDCKHYYFYSAQFDQPYPEISCLKGYWECICSQQEYDLLFEENLCKDFEALKIVKN